jgi:metal-sulfur cluster biosynthetic enzyme
MRQVVAAVERDLVKVREVEDFGVDLTLSFTVTKDMA